MSNDLNKTFEGTVTHVLPEEKKTDRFKHKMIFIEVQDGNYKVPICLQFVNDKIPKADGIGVGDIVKADCNIKGNLHNGRCFNSFDVWRVEIVNKYNDFQQPEALPEPTQTSFVEDVPEENILPF